MGLGGAWTLWEVANLGEANYGEYRQYIFVAFAIIGLLAFKYALISCQFEADAFLPAFGQSDIGWCFGRYEEPLRCSWWLRFMQVSLYRSIWLFAISHAGFPVLAIRY